MIDPSVQSGLQDVQKEPTADCTLPKARILLAEDNIINQQVTLAVLENMGLSADAVANGQEAINALETVRYDLVLMDCQMPVVDGYDATRVIRNPQSRVHNHQIPVIAMTAHANRDERNRCLESGMDDFLSKPVNPQTLVEILEKWLPFRSGYPSGLASSGCLGQLQENHATAFPMWDREGMLDRLMGDARVARIIIQGFLADLPLQIQGLRACLVAGDTTGVVRQAHSIKGATAIIGGERLKAVAMAIEQSAPMGHLDLLHTQIEAIDREFELLQQKLQQELLSPDAIKPDQS